MVANALYYTTPERATFAMSLKLKTGKNFAAGVVTLRGAKHILASLNGVACAWAEQIGVDVVDVSESAHIFYLALAPADSVAPTAQESFWNVPGRVLASTGKDSHHVRLTATKTAALSYKVKGGSLEDAPVAVAVIGVLRKETTTDQEYHFGFDVTFKQSGKGLGDAQDGTAEAAT